MDRQDRESSGSGTGFYLPLILAGIVAVAGGGYLYWDRSSVGGGAGTAPGAQVSAAPAEAPAARTRLADAMVRREDALLGEGANSVRAAQLAERIERLRSVAGARPDRPADRPASAPADTAERPPLKAQEWLEAASGRQLEALIAAREELVRRGSTDAYRYEAEVAWELEYLVEAAHRLGHPTAVPPENVFEFVDNKTLQALEGRWVEYEARYKSRAASAPQDAFAGPLELAASKLRLIRAALTKPQIDVQSAYLSPKEGAVSAAEFTTWSEEKESVREARIAELEYQLLKKALAIDGTNVGARSRLAELQEGADLAERVARARAGLVMERARGFSPDLAAAGRSAQVKELLKARFRDPFRATGCEALLTVQFDELQRIVDPAVRAQVLPEPLANSILDWMVSELNDGDLAEAKALHVEATRWLERIDTANPTEADKATVAYDRIMIEAEGKALDREIEFRREKGRSRAPQVQMAVLDLSTRSMLERHAAAKVEDLGASESGRQALWEAQKRYSARAAVPNPEVHVSLRQLALRGFEGEVARLEADLEELRRVDRNQSRAQGEEFKKEWKAAVDALVKRANRLRGGATELAVSEPQAVRDLESRIERVEKTAADLDPSRPKAEPAVVVVWHGDGPDMGGWPEPNGPRGPRGPPDPTGSPADGGKPRPKSPNGGSASVAGAERPSRAGESRPGLVSPYGDAELYRLTIEFRHRIGTALAELGTSPRRQDIRSEQDKPREGKPYVAFDNAAPTVIRTAVTGERPKPEGWVIRSEDDKTRSKVEFQHIDRLKSFRVIPGGVALGQTAEVQGTWDKAGLIYVGRERRFLFILPDGTQVRFPEVDPAVLKACVLFVQSKDPVAVSIGRVAGSNRMGRAEAPVLIQPDLQDSAVGLGAIEADRLPWSLRSERLPNGAKNPAQEKMQALVDAATKIPEEVIRPLIDRLAEEGKLDEQTAPGATARPEALCRRAVRKLGTGTNLGLEVRAAWDKTNPEARVQRVVDLLKEEGKHFKKETEARADLLKTFKSLPEDPRQAIQILLLSEIAYRKGVIPWDTLVAGCMIYAAGEEGKASTLREAAATVLRLMQSNLSLLTDDRVQFKQVGKDMSFTASLKIRYVKNKIAVQGVGLERSDEVQCHEEASQAATDLIPALENDYPSLRRLREYASWMAFVRWTLGEGKVRWMDLSDLKGVAYRTVPTPDYLIRGSREQREKAAQKFGLESPGR
jgi:hypothetical protein